MLTALLLPPVGLAVAGLVLVVAIRSSRRALAVLLVLLLVLAMPITADSLLASLSIEADPAGAPPQAIVILSADMRQTPDGARVEPGPLSLDRLRAGAALERRTGLPILVSGGPEGDSTISLGATMARSLADDLSVKVRWVEAHADDTWQNAQFSAPILRSAGVTRVYLVTHGWHMRRAAYVFRHFGIEVTPAPVWQDDWPEWSLAEFIPDARAWLDSYYGLHEWLGLAYYVARG